MYLRVTIDLRNLKVEIVADVKRETKIIETKAPSRRKQNKDWDYIELPDGRYRCWPESVFFAGYHIWPSRNSVLVQRICTNRHYGSICRNKAFEIVDRTNAPQHVAEIALQMYDEMVLGTLRLNRRMYHD